jgi:hypothetical protein
MKWFDENHGKQLEYKDIRLASKARMSDNPARLEARQG